jgi:hypothetical protein
MSGILSQFKMESIDLSFAEEALGAIARKAMKGILLDTMFDVPSLKGVEGVVITKQVVAGTAPRCLFNRTVQIEPATGAPERGVLGHQVSRRAPRIGGWATPHLYAT